MNSLREHTGYLTKCSFDSFSGIRDQKVLPRFMRLLGVTFSGNHQINTFCLFANQFIVVISICTIAIYNAIFRQIKEQVFHSINIMITPRKHRKFNWDSIHCCNYLNSEPIEVFSHRRFIAPVLLPLNKLRSTDTNVFTGSYRETVNNIF
jgi:hypothetical protein